MQAQAHKKLRSTSARILKNVSASAEVAEQTTASAKRNIWRERSQVYALMEDVEMRFFFNLLYSSASRY